MTPHDTTTSGTSDQTTNTSTSPNYASMALGGLQTLGSLFGPSDKKVKKNIVALGPDGSNHRGADQELQFQGQAPGSPKTIGPLAQDVEKAMPGSTARGSAGCCLFHVKHWPRRRPRSPTCRSTLPTASRRFCRPRPRARQVCRRLRRASPPALKPCRPSLPPTGRNKALASVTAPELLEERPGALANTRRSPRVMGALG